MAEQEPDQKAIEEAPDMEQECRLALAAMPTGAAGAELLSLALAAGAGLRPLSTGSPEEVEEALQKLAARSLEAMEQSKGRETGQRLRR